MGVTEGACGPVLVHCDETQTEEKKQKEFERQRNGEVPVAATVQNLGASLSINFDTPDGAGVNIRVSQDDTAVMLDVATLEAIKKMLV